MPALGMHMTGTCEYLERWRRCSLISVGPVAQLSPIASMPSGSRVGQGRADLAAHEHRAGRLDRHLDEDRQADARLGDRLLAAVHRRLGLQQVLRGFDQEGVGAAPDEAEGLLGEGRLEVRVGGAVSYTHLTL